MQPSLLAQYKHKIKTPQELREIIGPFPREKKVIMCHGVFDVVHPGHMRHLHYAKSKADVLVVSVTADRHITKGIYRPHIPQELRAANLAAYELVDYVVIDVNPKPIENIAAIQPDYFAKGFEYVAKGMPPKTAEEAEVLEAYGGEIIFTPGYMFFSSTEFIEMAPPELQHEKLLTLMDREGLTFERMRETIHGMGKHKVHVVGDTIVDTLTYTTLIGAQAKTPTMSVLYEEHKDYVGGAGIVAMHLKAAGAEVAFSTVLGDDDMKDFVLGTLTEAQVDCRAIIDSTRPTTRKNAIVASGYRLLKLDTVDNRGVSDKVVRDLSEAVANVACDAVVFSDFRHGMFNRRSIPTLTAAIPNGRVRVADSQVASRWGNITDFKGFDLITPNEREARFALGDQDTGIRPLADQLYDAAQCKALILKMGDRGVLACRSRDHLALDSFCVVDSFVDRLIDPVGAGDALLAYATLSLLTDKNVALAAILGSLAAACECERDGNIPILPDHVIRKIDSIEKKCKFQQ